MSNFFPENFAKKLKDKKDDVMFYKSFIIKVFEDFYLIFYFVRENNCHVIFPEHFRTGTFVNFCIYFSFGAQFFRKTLCDKYLLIIVII